MKSSPQGRERPAAPVSGPIALFGALRGAKAGAAGGPHAPSLRAAAAPRRYNRPASTPHPLPARQHPLRAARKKRSAVLRQQTSPVRLVRLMSAGSLPPCRTKITSFSLKSKYSPTFIRLRCPRRNPPQAAGAPAETGRNTRPRHGKHPTKRPGSPRPEHPADRPADSRQADRPMPRPSPAAPTDAPGRAPAIRAPRAPARSRARRRARPSRGWRCGGCGRRPASSGTPS